MESVIQKTLDLLVKHIQGIELHKPGSRPNFEISVSFSGYGSDKRPTVNLRCNFYDGDDHQVVKAASFNAVVDEVNRRLGFHDREALKLDEVERGLMALPAPEKEWITEQDL